MRGIQPVQTISMRLREFLTEEPNPNLILKYVKDVEGNENRGWIVHRIRAYKDGKVVGYLKLSYIPKDRFDDHYPGILNYLTQIGGKSVLPYDMKTVPWEEIPADKLGEHIYHMAMAAHMSWNEANYLSKLGEGNPERIKQIVMGLEKKLLKQDGKQFRRFRAHTVDKPIVDFIRVEPEYRKQGIGTKLYDAAVRWMKNLGLPLYMALDTKGPTEKIWNKLEKKYSTKIEKVSDMYHNNKRFSRKHFPA